MDDISEHITVELTFTDGLLTLHKYHPLTGEHANAPEGATGDALAMFERLLAEGALFAWLKNGAEFVRVELGEILIVAARCGMGLRLCGCDHSENTVDSSTNVVH